MHTPEFRRLAARIVAAIAFVLVTATSAAQPAAVRMPTLFDDHMMVQREAPVRIWGWATPGSEVRVALGGTWGAAVAGPDSAFSVELAPFGAGGPYRLQVLGPDTLLFENVLVGDIWLAGGQSNMEWPVAASNDAENEIRNAQYPDLRLFTVERGFAAEPENDVVASGWHAASPESIGDFSAVAYFFGRRLYDELQVPIGLLESNWGGSAAEAWMTPAALADIPDFRPLADSMLAGQLTPVDLFDRTNGRFEERLRAWRDQVRLLDPGFAGEGPHWSDVSFSSDMWDEMDLPQPWERAGLEDYDGVVWFRRSFDIPASWADDTLLVSLADVDDQDETWINGIRVGSGNTYGARSYTVPPGVVQRGENTIAIRVIDRGGEGGLRGEPARLFVRRVGSSAPDVSLAGSWAYRVALDLENLPPMPNSVAPNHIPSGLNHAMIAPVAPFPIKGVIWYQGESNAGRAYQYRTLFPRLIEDWRAQFDNPEMPFLFVQLANFMAAQTDSDEESAWAELREAQAMTLSVPNTAMAVTIDVGEADDIHPRNKQDVGTRLALAALAKVYDRDIVYSGPTYAGMRRDGDAIRILFDHAGSGLTARGSELKGFAIAGPDGHFVWADARIHGNTVLVSSPEVSDPRAVRYGWANNPHVNLYNREGLPAVPFRTDDIPGVTY